MSDLEEVLKDLKDELAAQRRERREGRTGGGSGAGDGGGRARGRSKIDYTGDAAPREIMDPVSKDQFDPRKQFERLIVEGKKFEQLNRQIFEAGGADIREMYGELAKGRTVFDDIGQASRKAFGSTEAGLNTMLASFKNIGQMEIITNEQRKSIVMTATALDQLGMPAEATTGIIDSLTRGFGMNVEESAAMAKGVYDLATSLQLPPRQLAEQFRMAQKDLGYSADKIGQVFTGLQRQSRITGISYGDLMGAVGESMDTFEGAASKAGSLNAVLGGPYLNSMELLTANEDQRIEMLQDAFAESGKNVDELGKYELKALAKQLGMSPENARRLLRGDATREELTKKIDERMDTAGTAEEIRMQDADEGMNELTTRFDKMIPPMERVAIQVDNFGESLVRLTPGLESQELYRVRDATATAIGGDARDAVNNPINKILELLDTQKPGQDALTTAVNQLRDVITGAEEKAPTPIKIKTPTVQPPEKKTPPSPKTDNQTNAVTDQGSAAAAIAPNTSNNIAAAFRKALEEQPLVVKLNASGKNISDLQALLFPDPTGGPRE